MDYVGKGKWKECNKAMQFNFLPEDNPAVGTHVTLSL